MIINLLLIKYNKIISIQNNNMICKKMNKNKKFKLFF